MRLYYHKTDGGAEYLCSSAVEGTDEGSFNSKYIVRIDGNYRKDAELVIKEVPDICYETDSEASEIDSEKSINKNIIFWSIVAIILFGLIILSIMTQGFTNM